MTRDEAIKKVAGAINFFPMLKDETAVQTKARFDNRCAELVDQLAALDVLKLDEPKGPNERAVDAMFAFAQPCGGALTPRHAIDAIHKAGLQIVEKSTFASKERGVATDGGAS